jgi:hypothetical protein
MADPERTAQSWQIDVGDMLVETRDKDHHQHAYESRGDTRGKWCWCPTRHHRSLYWTRSSDTAYGAISMTVSHSAREKDISIFVNLRAAPVVWTIATRQLTRRLDYNPPLIITSDV